MISNKIKWSIGLLLIIVLIGATNFIDRNNFKRIQDSVATIYEDRLVAKDLIFEMQLNVHDKELLLAQNKDTTLLATSKASQKQLEGFISSFSNTELTIDEEKVFKNLEDEFAQLFILESQYSAAVSDKSNSQKIESQLKRIKITLLKLSDIQIAEGNRQMHIGKKAMKSIELLTQMEVWIMIFIALVIQFVILYSPKEKVEEQDVEQ